MIYTEFMVQKKKEFLGDVKTKATLEGTLVEMKELTSNRNETLVHQRRDGW